MADLLPAATLLLGLCLGALLVGVPYTQELRRITRFLRERDARSNARLTSGAPLPGAAELARAVNDELERGANARIAVQRHQQEFQRDLSSLSHDIRTPLTGAKGYLQLAAEEADPATRSERLSAAATRIDATANLLDQLFAYTKACDPDLTLEFEPVALRPLVEQVLLGHYPEFEKLGWEPEIRTANASGADTILDADRTALTRIVENLVSNALRHGTDAPVIQIGCEGKRAILSVSNLVTDAEHLDPTRLFDRFYQADSARGHGGAGLGLATSAKLAEAMGLELSAHLDGSTLTIELSERAL